MSKKKSNKAVTEEIVVTPTVEETTAPVMEKTPVSETPTTKEPAQTTTVVAEEKQKGRPIVPGCARQIKLAARAAKAAEGKYVGRGRPVIEGSARQQRVAALNAKIAAGIPIKPGRPPMVKPEVVVAIEPAQTTEVQTKATVEA